MLSAILLAAACAPAPTAPMGAVSYNTTVESSQSGSIPTAADGAYSFTLPQFDPALGTLDQVTITVTSATRSKTNSLDPGYTVLSNLGTNALTMVLHGGVSYPCSATTGDPGGIDCYVDIQDSGGNSVVDASADQLVRVWNAPAGTGSPPHPRITYDMDQSGTGYRNWTSGFSPFIGTGNLNLQAEFDTTRWVSLCDSGSSGVVSSWYGKATVTIVYQYH